MQALASIFTGKGGTIRMIVVGLVALGILDIATEYDYQMDGTYKKDSSFSFKPAGTKSVEPTEEEDARYTVAGRVSSEETSTEA